MNRVMFMDRLEDYQILKTLGIRENSMDLVVDTDAYNEIDDQFALAYVLASDSFNLKAVCAAPFFNARSKSPADGCEKSFDEIHHILKLAGREEHKDSVYMGSLEFLSNENTPVISPAAEKIAALAMNYTADRPLYVAAVGAITNVASAILINPEIVKRMVVVWLGGHARHWPDAAEFNLIQDVAAARVVFNSGVPLVQLPCLGVVSSFSFSGDELKARIEGKNRLCDYLYERTVEMYAHKDGSPWSKILWDVTVPAYLAGGFTREYIVPSPVIQYDGRYSTDPSRHPMKYVYHIERDALAGDLFNKLCAF